VRRLLVAASVVPSSPILGTLTKEALSSSETSVPTRPTRRKIPEDTILHSEIREILKSYILLFSFLGVGWTLGALGTSATFWPTVQPWVMDECAAVKGMLSKFNPSAGENLCQ
jgi:hypothetical protein